MAKIFIDCGAHMFGGFTKLVDKHSIDECWKCYAFECNPFTFEASKKNIKKLTDKRLDITHLKKAVYIEDSKIKVNCSRDHAGTFLGGYVGLASNILQEPPLSDAVSGAEFNYKEEEIIAETINLSDFLRGNFSENDFVVMKLDVEGVEFLIIPHLIETGAIKLIDILYCEFHERFFADSKKYEELKEKYIKQIVAEGITFEEWV